MRERRKGDKNKSEGKDGKQIRIKVRERRKVDKTKMEERRKVDKDKSGGKKESR